MERTETLRLSRSVTVPVVYEDKYLMAINKPSGLIVAPAHWEQTSRNLMKMLRDGLEMGTPWAKRRNLRFICNIHRLDSDTSGVLLLAKNRPALAQMTKKFEERRVSKLYLAVVEGNSAEDSFTVSEPIAPHPKYKNVSCIDRKNGREAVTHFTTLERFPNYSLIQAEPVTGRTHQIRIHLAHAGLPVLGDALYGSNIEPTFRLALHASALRFLHPFTRRAVEILAPLPKDIERLVSRLRRVTRD